MTASLQAQTQEGARSRQLHPFVVRRWRRAMILFTKALSRILLFKAAQASIDRIASHPREIAAALLASNDGENALYSRMGEVEQLSRSHLVLIWEPTWDDFIVAEKILEQLNLTPAQMPPE